MRQEKSTEPGRTPKTAGAPLRFLVVDDDRVNRRVLTAMLVQAGYEVTEATDGVAAVAAFELERPDMVLMDIMMPVMDGYEATRRIKLLVGDGFVPVIFVTALTDGPALARCIEVGGEDFLSKPINRVLLQAKIDALLRTRELYRMLAGRNTELTRLHDNLLREQQLAERVFHNIVHRASLDAPGIRHHISPAALFNGDLLLAARRPFGGLLVMLGDFTGHGLPAAVGAVPVSELFYAMAAKGYSIAEIVAEVNRKLKATLPTELFLAACFIELDVQRSCLSVWNGGLPDVLIRPSTGDHLARLPSTHLPLGVVGNERLDTGVLFVEYHPGDRLYLYTDGVPETPDASGRRFGQKRVHDALLVTDEQPFDSLWNSLAKFRGGAGQADDIILLELDTQAFHGGGVPCDHFGPPRARLPAHWKLALELQADALRQAEPLPAFLQMVMELQGVYAHRERLYMILAELYTNALEHGLLGLDSRLKTGPDGFGAYFDARLAALAALGQGSIRLEIEHRPEGDGGRLALRVQDSGAGFDLARAMSGLEQGTVAGRGLALLRTICSELHVMGSGNCIEAQYVWL
jgi:CheY-like chemotaxis protein/anti-sigma regulatory factor (Ser/Thr protein kinase)